jgi:hypothetical protein
MDGLRAEKGQSKLTNDLKAVALNQSITNSALLQVKEDRILVDVVALNDAETLLPQLKSLRLEEEAVFGRVISGSMPISVLNQMENLTELAFARPSYKPITNVGLTTSQADRGLRVDTARTTFNVNGTGQTVGVLSDSYNTSTETNIRAADDVRSGDLPGPGNPNGFTTPVNVLEDDQGKDEGRAMLQLIHDLAPGARLAFAPTPTEPAFAQNIIRLADAGATVIVDDISFFSEPFFQDGIVAQAVDRVFARGIPYFSAAGNDARQSYEAPFRPSGQQFSLVTFPAELHDFDPGSGVDTFQRFRLQTGESIRLSFQWADSFFSASGVGARTDLDIFLLNDAGTQILDRSFDQNIGRDAFEILEFTNNGPTTFFNLAITRFTGPTPSLIKYIDFRGGTSGAEFFTNSSTIVGHANAAGAFAVAAAPFFRTPEFGVNPPVVDEFSGYGGTPILFTSSGQPTNILRNKPDATAIDGTNTTFFGRDISGDTDNFPNFFGTSAAAPHAAAVAALMRQANPNATPTQIYNALRNSAIDMDDPLAAGFQTGFDIVTGTGLIQADRALQLIVGGTPTLPTVMIVATDANAAEANRDPGVFTITRTGATTNPLTVNFGISGTATNGTDYDSLTGSVTISAGQTTATVTVRPIDDTLVEGNETAVLTLSSNANYTIGTQNSSTVTIADNDGTVPPPNLTQPLGATIDDIIVTGINNRIIDFGGADNYTIRPNLIGDVEIVDNNSNNILLPVGLRIRSAQFISNGLRLGIGTNRFVTFLGTPQNNKYIVPGDPLNPTAGTSLTYGQFASQLGATIGGPEINRIFDVTPAGLVPSLV